MRFQDRVVAVVADGVEVQVKARAAGGQAERSQVLDEAGEQLLVGLAANPVGVGAQVGGLGKAARPRKNARPASSVILSMWWTRGTRVQAASSRAATECQADSWVVAG